MIIAYHQKFIDKNLEIILEEERTEQKQKKEQERYIRDTMQRMNITNKMLLICSFYIPKELMINIG